MLEKEQDAAIDGEESLEWLKTALAQSPQNCLSACRRSRPPLTERKDATHMLSAVCSANRQYIFAR